MFPPAPNTRQARPQWRAAVRRAVDLLVAFATLEDPELDAPYADEPDPGRRAQHARRDPAAEPAEHVADPHPHRTPLRPAVRAGRPGVVPERPTPCTAPVSHRRRRSDHQRVPHPAG